MTDELSGDLEEPALSPARGRPSKIDLYAPFSSNGVHKTLVVFEQTEIEQCRKRMSYETDQARNLEHKTVEITRKTDYVVDRRIESNYRGL
jgi:hypothetical protein